MCDIVCFRVTNTPSERVLRLHDEPPASVLTHCDVVMGCVDSKAEDASKKLGAEANGTKGLPGDGEFSNIAQAHNEALGLSQRQTFSIKQSWKGIKRRMEETGVDMFVR